MKPRPLRAAWGSKKMLRDMPFGSHLVVTPDRGGV